MKTMIELNAEKQYVSVPVEELEKLEQARKDLYRLVSPFTDIKGGISLYDMMKVTGQIWRVANTKDWKKEIS